MAGHGDQASCKDRQNARANSAEVETTLAPRICSSILAWRDPCSARRNRHAGKRAENKEGHQDLPPMRSCKAKGGHTASLCAIMWHVNDGMRFSLQHGRTMVQVPCNEELAGSALHHRRDNNAREKGQRCDGHDRGRKSQDVSDEAGGKRADGVAKVTPEAVDAERPCAP